MNKKCEKVCKMEYKHNYRPSSALLKYAHAAYQKSILLTRRKT